LIENAKQDKKNQPQEFSSAGFIFCDIFARVT